MTVAKVVFDWLEKLKVANHERSLRSHEPVEPKPTARKSKAVEKAKAVKDVSGFVYVMKSGTHYKIGMTSRQSGRINEIKVLFPIVKLIHQIACSDAKKVEVYLHKKYKKQRITHEWYSLTREDVQWFKSLKDYELDNL